MNNKLGDLNNHLFAQLERLNDESLTEEQLQAELKRADGVTKIASQIIQNGHLQFKVIQHMDEYDYFGNKEKHMPAMLEVKE